MTEYNTLVHNIYHRAFAYQVNVASFGGPSRYFHQQAIVECKNNFLSDRHIEMIYATLVAWGMHRTGKGGAKMPDYEMFKQSILKNVPILQKYRTTKIEDIPKQNISAVITDLSNVCFGENAIIASTTKSRLVSASKTLAHILPDLVPPMDRQYTIRFFNNRKGNDNLTLKYEQKFFEDVMSTMYDFYQDKKIFGTLQPIVASGRVDSLPKLFDDLIIASLQFCS